MTAPIFGEGYALRLAQLAWLPDGLNVKCLADQSTTLVRDFACVTDAHMRPDHNMRSDVVYTRYRYTEPRTIYVPLYARPERMVLLDELPFGDPT